MPPYRGSQIGPTRKLGGLDINQLLQESQREIRPATGDGMASSLVGNMHHVALLPEIVDPAQIRQSFIGQIVPEGPEEEEDHEGAMYWVRETTNATPKGTDINGRPVFELLDDAREEAYGAGYELSFRPARWVTAINLGEFDPLDENVESHALVFGLTPLVHVFQQTSADGLPRWYFDRAVGGTQLGVVRTISNDDSPTVGVQAVQTNPDTGELEFVGDVVELACWPGLFGRHYRPFLWPPRTPGGDDPVFPETNILKVTFVDNEWKVEQTMRYSFPPLPPAEEEYPILDCNVVRPLLPG